MPEQKSQSLKGAPPHARIKSYSAETGFVYQYVYRGYRPTAGGSGTEYVFETTRDRKLRFSVAVHLMSATLDECTALLGRELIAAERYALAKMELFAALDTIADVAQFAHPLVPTSANAERHLRVLGRL